MPNQDNHDIYKKTQQMKILTESEKKKILIEREQAIINSFAKTFNSIKRIDENEIGSAGMYPRHDWNIVKYKEGGKIPVKNITDLPQGYENLKIGDVLTITGVRRNANGVLYDTNVNPNLGLSNDNIANLMKGINENEEDHDVESRSVETGINPYSKEGSEEDTEEKSSGDTKN
jgi:hypothetical protein